MTYATMKPIPFPISPLYIWPSPVQKNDRTAAKPGLLSVLTITTCCCTPGLAAKVLPAPGACVADDSLPQLGQNLCVPAIVAPQPEQYIAILLTLGLGYQLFDEFI